MWIRLGMTLASRRESRWRGHPDQSHVRCHLAPVIDEIEGEQYGEACPRIRPTGSTGDVRQLVGQILVRQLRPRITAKVERRLEPRRQRILWPAGLDRIGE